MGLLNETFDAVAGWSTLDEDGALRWVVLHAPPSWPPPGLIDDVVTHRDEHPLVRWYAVAADLGPMTTDRVPEHIAAPELVARAREVVGSPDLHHQLAVPLHLDERSHAVFVLARGGRDFDETQLRLARQLQPLLMLAERTADHASRLGESTAQSFGLTSREAAVLELLGRGLTVHAISRRLCCTPRTVEKHLEHLYRKLEVHDRLSAIRAVEAHERASGGLDGSHRPSVMTQDQPPSAVCRGELLVLTGRTLTD